MFGFCPLASGSKGNCLYLGSENTKVLIDAGISASLIEDRLSEIGVTPNCIKAIFITHEHSDHIKGISQFVKKWPVPLIANAETAKAVQKALKQPFRFKIFTTGEPFEFGDLFVKPFSVPHDTLDPVGFVIEIHGVKLGICADIGYATSLVKKQLEKCHYLYLEANHQPSMVHSSNRPHYLKQRILGRQGHLSNEDCGKLLEELLHQDLKHVHLAHLSDECNTEEAAMTVVKEAIKDHAVELSIAHQHKISKLIQFKCIPIVTH